MLRQSVAPIDAQICTCDVLGRVAEEESHSAHEIFWGSHLANGDERSPLVAKLRVFVEDFACSTQLSAMGVSEIHNVLVRN